MSDRLEKLAQAGGAPNIVADADEVRGKIMDLQELLDIIHDDAKAIADSYETEEPVPFEVGTETIAAIALIALELRDAIPELERHADRLGFLLYGIDAVRRAQDASKN